MNQTNKQPRRASRRTLSLMGAVMIAGACADDADTRPAQMTLGIDAGAEPDSGSSRPLYALASRVTLPSGGVTLIAVIDSLAAGLVDSGKTLEIGGFGSAHGSPTLPGALFVGSAESPTFTRYAVAADGALTKEQSLSLSQYGLKSAPRTVVFASASKAYAIAVEAYQVFVWDPQTMTISGVIDLPMLKREGFAPMWVFQAALRDGKLHVPIGWSRVGGDPGSAPESAIVTIDLASDQVEIQEEKRCGGLRAIFRGGEGDLFFSSSAGAPATWRRLYGESAGSEPCLVRMRPGTAALDQDYLGRPSELSGGRVAVDFSPAGGGHLIFQTLDEDLHPIRADSTPEQLWSAAAWRFWRVPLSALDAGVASGAEPVDLPASALNALRFKVEGRDYLPQIKGDYSETTLVDVTDPAQVAPGPTIRGSVGNFFRVR